MLEYKAALAATRNHHLAPLLAAGVAPEAFQIGPAVARIHLSRDRSLFDFDPESEDVAFILPIRGSNPTSPEAADPVDEVLNAPIVDLLAFSAAFPNRWALRRGSATWLGAVEPQLLMPAPVPVWRSPLRWLGNGGAGIVLLSRDRRDRYRTMTCLDTVVAEDEQHATEMRELLARPWLAPAVLVRIGREVRRRAA